MTNTPSPKRPLVGVGILIFNHEGKLLLGRRVASHGVDSWSPPGGHLEYGESFEDCAIREAEEEVGITPESVTFLSLSSDIHPAEGKHYINIMMYATCPKGAEIVNNEPHKTQDWQWCDPAALPTPLFLPIVQLLEGKVYIRNNPENSPAARLFDPA